VYWIGIHASSPMAEIALGAAKPGARRLPLHRRHQGHPEDDQGTSAVQWRERVVLAFDGSACGDSTALVGCTMDGHL
jgi:hypothetical protein